MQLFSFVNFAAMSQRYARKYRKTFPGFTEAKKKTTMTQIFGNSYTYGLVDSMAMKEFDERMNALNTEWEIGGVETVEFKEYFRKFKEDEFNITW